MSVTPETLITERMIPLGTNSPTAVRSKSKDWKAK
jgi:hypothetical protein